MSHPPRPRLNNLTDASQHSMSDPLHAPLSVLLMHRSQGILTGRHVPSDIYNPPLGVDPADALIGKLLCILFRSIRLICRQCSFH
jgi:hypothetical protein